MGVTCGQLDTTSFLNMFHLYLVLILISPVSYPYNSLNKKINCLSIYKSHCASAAATDLNASIVVTVREDTVSSQWKFVDSEFTYQIV